MWINFPFLILSILLSSPDLTLQKITDDILCRCFAKDRGSEVELVDAEPCFFLRAVPGIGPSSNKVSLFVSFVARCRDRYAINEVAIEAINQNGVPYGFWKSVDYVDTKNCYVKYTDVKLKSPREPAQQKCYMDSQFQSLVLHVRRKFILLKKRVF